MGLNNMTSTRLLELSSTESNAIKREASAVEDALHIAIAIIKDCETKQQVETATRLLCEYQNSFIEQYKLQIELNGVFMEAINIANNRDKEI